MNTTFCMAPWVNIGIVPSGNFSLCCVSIQEDRDMSNKVENPYEHQRKIFEVDTEDELHIGSIHDNTLEEIWNNDKMKTIRLKMLKGEPILNCETCYYSESITGTSERKRFEQKYFYSHKDKLSQTKPDGSIPFEPLEWDLRLTNTCNFKCRDCYSVLSSSWEEESKRLNVDVSAPKIDEQKVLDELEPLYSSVKEVYFAGGEPFISDHHYHIIDKLLENDADPTIRYNTNLSTLTYKGRDLIEIWKNFTEVELHVSFDGLGERGELIRKGFDSKRFIKNIQRIQKELPNLVLHYNFVVYLLNAYHFMDAHEFMVDHKILRTCDSITFTLLQDPQYLRITTLDSESKKEVIEKIQNSKLKSHYDHILRYLLKEDNSSFIPQFKFMTDGLDAIRNESTLETIPELHRLLK